MIPKINCIDLYNKVGVSSSKYCYLEELLHPTRVIDGKCIFSCTQCSMHLDSACMVCRLDIKVK